MHLSSSHGDQSRERKSLGITLHMCCVCIPRAQCELLVGPLMDDPSGQKNPPSLHYTHLLGLPHASGLDHWINCTPILMDCTCESQMIELDSSDGVVFLYI